MVVHNRDEIANILSDAINDGKDDDDEEDTAAAATTTTAGKKGSRSGQLDSSSHLHLEPVVEMWCALAKDLQQDFAPYFPRFADAVIFDMTFKVQFLHMTFSVLILGASINDVRSGWGRGLPKKQTKGTKSADL